MWSRQAPSRQVIPQATMEWGSMLQGGENAKRISLDIRHSYCSHFCPRRDPKHSLQDPLCVQKHQKASYDPNDASDKETLANLRVSSIVK